MNRNSVFTAALCTLGAIALAHPGAAAAATILPGYWESTDQVTFPIQSLKTERKCISEAQIESYMSGPVNKHYSCHYNARRIGQGVFTMQGDCVDNNGLTSKIQIDGTYTPTSFKMNGHLQVTLGGLAIPVTASTDAHRISAECPAEPERK